MAAPVFTGEAAVTVTQMALSDPDHGLYTLLTPSDYIRTATVDVVATVRENTEDLAYADGTLDTTQFVSAAAVSIELTAVDTVSAVMDELSQFCMPHRRPYLVVSDDEWLSDRQIQLRFDSHSHPWEIPTYRQVQLQFKAPRGLWEDTLPQVVELAAAVPDVTGFTFTAASGATVTATYGLRFPVSQSAGDTLVTVTGSARARWSVKLYGPCTGPKIVRTDTGQEIRFADSLTIAPGDYVELGPDPYSALYLSDPGSPVLAQMDYTISDWFALEPGTCRLRYYASSGTAPGSIAELTVYPLWMA